MAPSKMVQPSTSQAPPDPASQATSDADLRAKLQEEIEQNSRLCGHKRYHCHLPREPGYSRCLQHITEEPTAPYRRCKYQAANRRCHFPARIYNPNKDPGLCFEHARAALAQRIKSISKPALKPSADTMMLSLVHHLNTERVRTESSASQISVVSEASDHDSALPPADPFKQINATDVNSLIGPNLLEYRSSSDSESEPLQRAGGHDEDSSGPEDTPFDNEPLRFAGIYTNEEVVRESCDVMKRLRSLYYDQMKVLGRKLKDARQSYLSSLKQERETHCSIHSQGGQTAVERKKLKELKAGASYRKRHGVDAVLYKKLHEKRSKISDVSTSHRSSAQSNRCCFSEGGVKCARSAMPAAKYCLKHILNDRHQVLFRSCGVSKAGNTCQEPVPVVNPNATCVYHMEMQPYQTFTIKKYESDSEDTTTDPASRASPFHGDDGRT